MNGKKRHTGLWFLPGILPAGFSLFSYRKLHGKQKRAAADVFFCEALKKRDGILVPGALVKNGVIGAQLKDRLDGALRLYRASIGKFILISGTRKEVKFMKMYLLFRGIPQENIYEDREGLDTFRTMKNTCSAFPGIILCVHAETLCSKDGLSGRSRRTERPCGDLGFGDLSKQTQRQDP